MQLNLMMQLNFRAICEGCFAVEEAKIIKRFVKTQFSHYLRAKARNKPLLHQLRLKQRFCKLSRCGMIEGT